MDVILRAKPTATAPGLLLRPWERGDVAALVEAHRDAELRRWLRTSLRDERQARDWVARNTEAWAAGTAYNFAVLERDRAGDAVGQPVGHLVVKGFRPDGEDAEVGYWTSARGRGRAVASRALLAVCDWAFGLARPTPLRHLDLLHTVGNTASCRVAEKCGFRLDATLPADPPDYPSEGHLHRRVRAGAHQG
jgi:RimJ/RimL family protein N-acetyltransferase